MSVRRHYSKILYYIIILYCLITQKYILHLKVAQFDIDTKMKAIYIDTKHTDKYLSDYIPHHQTEIALLDLAFSIQTDSGIKEA